MRNTSSEKMIDFLLNEIGIKRDSLELGIKLSIKNNSPLPVQMWSYGILTLEELDKLYSYLFQNTE